MANFVIERFGRRFQLVDVGTESGATVYSEGVSQTTLLAGEDQTNNRLLVDMKPADSDSTLETLQSAAGATGNGTPINVKGYESITLHVTGTFVQTITFEGTLDDTNWFSIAVRDTTQVNATTLVTSTTTVGAYVVPVEYCLSQVRARVSAFTSGTSTVKSRKSAR